MTIFESLWKRWNGIPKGNVTTFEGRDLANAPRPKEDLTPYLKDIFYGKKHSEYVGATLSFMDKDEEVVIINMAKGQSDDENFWLCMNYVKYKGRDTVWYNEAEKHILGREDMEVEVAKLFLEKTNA